MSKKISLPGDNWANFRESDEVPEKFRRKVLSKSAAISAQVNEDGNVDTTGDNLNRFLEAQDALIVALVSSWSFDVPVSEEALLDLPGAAYDALKKEAAPHLNEVLPDFGASSDAESPTSPSSE